MDAVYKVESDRMQNLLFESLLSQINFLKTVLCIKSLSIRNLLKFICFVFIGDNSNFLSSLYAENPQDNRALDIKLDEDPEVLFFKHKQGALGQRKD